MPAIYLFQRRTFLGGDDLQPAVLLALVLRLFQLTLLLGPLFAHLAHESRDSEGGFFGYILFDQYDTSSGWTISEADLSCRHSHVFGMLLLCFAVASTVYCLASAILEWRISVWASLGSPTETEPRSKRVTSLLELKLLPFSLLLFVVFFMGIAMLSFAPHYYRCQEQDHQHRLRQEGHASTTVQYYMLYADQQAQDNDDGDAIENRHFLEEFKLWWVTTFALLLTQFTEIAVSWIYLLHICRQPRSANHFDSSERVPLEQYNEHHERQENGQYFYSNISRAGGLGQSHELQPQNHELVEEMWAERCANMCHCLGVASCFMFGGREVIGQGDFGDVARALADYLETRGVLDVVPSDIAAGFLVLRGMQKSRVHRTRQSVVQELQEGSSNYGSNPSLSTLPQQQLQQQQQQRQSGQLRIPPPLLSYSRTSTSSSYATAPTIPANDSLLSGPMINVGEDNVPDDNHSTSGSSFHSCQLPGDEENPAAMNESGDLFAEIDRRSIYRPAENPTFSYYYYERESRKILNPNDVHDMAALQEGARYAKYALAIYTWVLYLYVHPVSGVPRLAEKGCMACLRSMKYQQQQQQQEQQRQNRGRENDTSRMERGGDVTPQLVSDYVFNANGRIEGDNMCHTHKTALLMTAGLTEADLVYAQLKSGFRDNPYCILLDHEWKCVVVSIRGTFSLEDCVSDVLIDPESLDGVAREFGFADVGQEGNSTSGHFCHGGMLMWVRNIYRDLQRHKLLDKLLLGPNAEYPDYCLRLVGHSLGAATCTILSYMLRPRFPNLRCVNYSPPGCSVTWELAVGCKEWCNSFVLDSDIVPRLSLDSMEAWRDEILELIGRIKVPKIEVAKRFMTGSEGNSCGICFDPPLDDPEMTIHDLEDILYDPDEVPETEYKRQLERFKHIQQERKRSRGERRTIKLFPPGKMIHLVKTGEKRACVNGVAKCLTCFTTNFGFEYTPLWINNDDLNEIVISPQMGTDHFPNRMLNCLNSIAKDYGMDPRTY